MRIVRWFVGSWVSRIYLAVVAAVTTHGFSYFSQVAFAPSALPGRRVAGMGPPSPRPELPAGGHHPSTVTAQLRFEAEMSGHTHGTDLHERSGLTS